MSSGTAALHLLAGLQPLLGELNDLKRIRRAGRAGSLAGRGFARAWSALVERGATLPHSEHGNRVPP